MMKWLTSWFTGVWNAFISWGEALVLTVFAMLKDALYFFLEMLLNLVEVVLLSLGSLFSAMDLTQYISAIPADVSNIMGLIGLGQAMSIVIAAIVIRVSLQLIPFVRLGS
jgi:hypothetical protein